MKHFGTLILSAALALPLLIAPQAARADSCWDHNGSLMRLQASGNDRWFSYDQPRQALWSSGVGQGTLLFNGQKTGDWYAGLARVFSSACPGQPLEYRVEGPVMQNPLRVVLRGTREVFANCLPTGRMTSDELIFVYRHDC
jgi:hypothetical protein